jgi:hypothetical protein
VPKKPVSRQCAKCGAELSNVRPIGEQVLVGTYDGRVVATSREFKGDCPEHGEIFAVSHQGHHSTQIESSIRRRYSKAIRKRLRGLLPPAIKKKFDRAWGGKYQPSTGEVARWDKLAGLSRMSASSVILGHPVTHLRVHREPEQLPHDDLTAQMPMVVRKSTKIPR